MATSLTVHVKENEIMMVRCIAIPKNLWVCESGMLIYIFKKRKEERKKE